MRTLIALAILLFSFSCRKADKGVRNDILKLSLSGEVSTLDPAHSYDTISGSIVYQVYEQLYQYHYLKRPYTVIPLLAEGMPTVENEGKKYTIRLKKNIRYHDHESFGGRPRFLKSQDFVNQLKRLAFQGTRSNGWWLFDGKIVGLNKFREQAGSDFEKFKNLKVTGLKTPNEHTLVIELTEPYPQLLFTLAMSFTSPMPSEYIAHNNNQLIGTMIGTGPFRLKEIQNNNKYILEKNPDYHEQLYPSEGDRHANEKQLFKDAGKKLPFLKKIEFSVMKESNTRWLNFRKKNIDLLVIPKDNYASVIDPDGGLNEEFKKDRIELEISPTLTYWWLSFNMIDPVLGPNLNLRKAIAHAIDVDRYIKVFTNNIGQKANSIYPPGIPGYDPANTLPHSYSVEKAKKFLELAGFPNGEGLPTLIYDVRGNSATNRQQAEFIKSELAKVNIKVDISLNTFPAFLDKARRGKLQFWQDGWAMDYPDAENSLQLLVGKNKPPGPNTTYYKNDEFDQLFQQLKSLPNGNAKKELMIKMENIVHNDMPWVMQYYARNYIVKHDYLKNYRPSDLINNYMKYLRVKSP